MSVTSNQLAIIIIITTTITINPVFASHIFIPTPLTVLSALYIGPFSKSGCKGYFSLTNFFVLQNGKVMLVLTVFFLPLLCVGFFVVAVAFSHRCSLFVAHCSLYVVHVTKCFPKAFSRDFSFQHWSLKGLIYKHFYSQVAAKFSPSSSFSFRHSIPAKFDGSSLVKNWFGQIQWIFFRSLADAIMYLQFCRILCLTLKSM